MSKDLRLHSVYFKISIDQVQVLTLFGQTKCGSFVVLVIQLKEQVISIFSQKPQSEGGGGVGGGGRGILVHIYEDDYNTF